MELSPFMAQSSNNIEVTNEPSHEKTNSLGFRPCPTQTDLYGVKSRLEALNFGRKNKQYYLCSDNKGAGHFLSYCTAFSNMQIDVFLVRRLK